MGSILREITPYVPALGILSVGITTSKHVYNHIGTRAGEDGHKEDAGEPVV